MKLIEWQVALVSNSNSGELLSFFSDKLIGQLIDLINTRFFGLIHHPLSFSLAHYYWTDLYIRHVFKKSLLNRIIELDCFNELVLIQQIDFHILPIKHLGSLSLECMDHSIQKRPHSKVISHNSLINGIIFDNLAILFTLEIQSSFSLVIHINSPNSKGCILCLIIFYPGQVLIEFRLWRSSCFFGSFFFKFKSFLFGLNNDKLISPCLILDNDILIFLILDLSIVMFRVISISVKNSPISNWFLL